MRAAGSGDGDGDGADTCAGDDDRPGAGAVDGVSDPAAIEMAAATIRIKSGPFAEVIAENLKQRRRAAPSGDSAISLPPPAPAPIRT